MKDKLFVYGTLKRGHPLGEYLGTSDFLKCGRILGLRMFDLGMFPCVVGASLHDRVYGEIFSVDEETLDLLDEVEGEAFERNRRITAEGDNVNIYLWRDKFPPTWAAPIEGGVWRKQR